MERAEVLSACGTSHRKEPYPLRPDQPSRFDARSIPRVSTDQGLEQDFNSLDAQHDAAQAYIRSQVHAGWTLIRSATMTGAIPAARLTAPPRSG
jgi:hypothetical protein